MGYSVSQGETTIFISKDNIPYLDQCTCAWQKDAKKHGFYDFTDNWVFQHNANGDIDYVSFEGEKLNEDYLFFDAIAPVMRDNSFIEMYGEDGDVWRWYFKDGQCHEIHATMSFAPFE